jgi:hypothetical protein
MGEPPCFLTQEIDYSTEPSMQLSSPLAQCKDMDSQKGPGLQ